MVWFVPLRVEKMMILLEYFPWFSMHKMHSTSGGSERTQPEMAWCNKWIQLDEVPAFFLVYFRASMECSAQHTRSTTSDEHHWHAENTSIRMKSIVHRCLCVVRHWLPFAMFYTTRNRHRTISIIKFMFCVSVCACAWWRWKANTNKTVTRNIDVRMWVCVCKRHRHADICEEWEKW